MLNLARPAFKKKVVKGKAKSRTRAHLLEDLEPVAVHTDKKPTPEPESIPKVSRWAQYAKLAQAHESLSTPSENPSTPSENPTAPSEYHSTPAERLEGSERTVDDSPHIRDSEQLPLSDADAPVVVDATSTLDPNPSTAGKLYVAPKTFLLKESHFRDRPIKAEKEYDTLSDDEPPKVEYEEDEPMADDSFVDDVLTRFDPEMYESEIMSMASDEDRDRGVKMAKLETSLELLSSLTRRIQELQVNTESRNEEIVDLKLHLDTALAEKKAVLARLHTIP